MSQVPVLIEIPEEITGERVVLRRYRPGDGAALWEAVEESRERLRPWMPWTDAHRTPEDPEVYVRQACARWALREDLPVGVWQRTTGRFLGGSGLHRIDWSIPSFEIGYWLRASAEGYGYMTEAVRLLCALAFDTLEANRVHIRCDANNIRSAAIPRRLRFVQEAVLRNDARSLSGELRDTLIFAMTPQDYAQVRAEH